MCWNQNILPFLDQWNFPLCLVQFSQDGPLYILRESLVIFYQTYCISFSKDRFNPCKHTPVRRQSKTLLTIDERGSKTA